MFFGACQFGSSCLFPKGVSFTDKTVKVKREAAKKVKSERNRKV